MYYNKLLIERKLKEFLEEDCHFKDVSSQFIPIDKKIDAKIVAKSEGYISGAEEMKMMYTSLDVQVKLYRQDGEYFGVGDIIAKLTGKARDILYGERVVLNLMTHMSSITSTTQRFINLIQKAGKEIRIACTRKTLPGLRIFEKKAVEIGGGDTHRFSLDDMILLKDTHLKFAKGDIETLLSNVKTTASFSKKIEIEVENVDDVLLAAKSGADIIMCDNMSPKQVKKAIAILKENELREKVIIEVSGGIGLGNVENYIECEPDIISTSEITLNPTITVDLSLKFC